MKNSKFRFLKAAISAVISAMLLVTSVCLPITVNAEETPKQFSVIQNGFADSVSYVNGICKLSSAAGGGVTHLSGWEMSLSRGGFNGTGVSFWLKGPATQTWGRVAMRSTDAEGNHTWFVTSSDYGNQAKIIDNTSGGAAFNMTVNYGELLKAADYNSVVSGSETHPTKSDIANFDTIRICVMIWDGWGASSSYLGTFSVLDYIEPEKLPENRVVADFENLSGISTDESVVSSVSVSDTEIDSGKSLLVSGNPALTSETHFLPVIISGNAGDFNGTAVSLNILSEITGVWDTFAVHTTDGDWFKYKWTNDDSLGSANNSGSAANTVTKRTFKYEYLVRATDWDSAVSSASTDFIKASDIVKIDKIVYAVRIWTGWGDNPSWYNYNIDTVKVRDYGYYADPDVVVKDFEDLSDVSTDESVVSSVSVSDTEIDSGKSLLVSGNPALTSETHFLPVIISGNAGDFNGGGVTLKIKSDIDGVWDTFAVHTTDGKWFKYKWTNEDTSATANWSRSKPGEVTLRTFGYDAFVRAESWDGAVSSASADVITAEDIAKIDSVVYAVRIWAGWGDNPSWYNFYLDSVTVKDYTAPVGEPTEVIFVDCGTAPMAYDADGNGKVNVMDLIRLKKYIAGIPGTNISIPAVDMSEIFQEQNLCDGIINASDLAALRLTMLLK